MTPVRVLAAGVLLGLALLVQVSVLTQIGLPGPTPNLVLLVVVALALAHGPLAGGCAGFLAGLALDVVPPADSAAGRWAFALCLVGYLGGLAAGAANSSVLAPLTVVALASLTGMGIYALLGAAVSDVRVTWDPLVELLPLAVLYDVVLAPLVIPLVAVLTRRPRRASFGAVSLRSVYRA